MQTYWKSKRSKGCGVMIYNNLNPSLPYMIPIKYLNHKDLTKNTQTYYGILTVQNLLA